MSRNLKDQINDAGKKVAEGVSQAADWVKEKTGLKDTTDLSGVREHMEVYASCGTRMGIVDRVEGGAIKLTRNSTSDGEHHFLPASMVERVDQHVHLNCNHVQAMEGWKADAASCGCA